MFAHLSTYHAFCPEEDLDLLFGIGCYWRISQTYFYSV